MTRRNDSEKTRSGTATGGRADPERSDERRYVPLGESSDQQTRSAWITELDGIDALSSGDPASLDADGRTVGVADGAVLTTYRIDDAAGCATEQWTAEFRGRITAVESLGDGRFVVVAGGDGGSEISVADADGCHALFELSTAPRSISVGGSRLFVATATEGTRASQLLVADGRSGTVERSIPLASGPVSVTASPSGRYVTVANRRTKTVRTMRSESACDGDGAERTGRCEPGVDGEPDDDGSTAVGKPDGSVTEKPTDPGGPDRAACRAQLDWSITNLESAGRFLVATDDRRRRLAIIDRTDLSVLEEVATGQDGRSLATNRRSTQLLSYDHGRERWERLDIDRLVETLPPRIVDDGDGSETDGGAEPAVFYGQSEPMSIEHVTTNDRMRVLAVPMIEPSQTWGDPDLSKLGTFVEREAWEEVRTYYDEVSFGTLDVEIDTFGTDVGSGTPVELPRSFRSYFWPDFEPGGLTVEHTFSALPTDVDLDGTESAEIRVSPRERAEETLSIPFCGLGSANEYDAYPVEIEFDGTETLELRVVDRGGTEHDLDVSFEPETVTITDDDPRAGLDDLEDYLDDRIDDAEGARDLLAPVEVYRVKKSGADFGELELNLSVDPTAGGTDTGRITVADGGDLDQLGLDSPIPGSFTVEPTGDGGDLETYLERALTLAETSAGYDYSNRLLGDTSVDVDGSSGTLTIDVELSENDGGGGASISLSSHSGLDSLGFDGAMSVVGSESDADNQNTMRDIESLADYVYTELVSRLPAGRADGLPEYDAILLCYVGTPDTSVPVSERWDVSEPDTDIDGLRMFRRGVTATNAADEEDQWQGSWIGTILDEDPDNERTMHELGHVLGFSDLYDDSDHRDDLKYMGNWAMMDNHPPAPHFCGYMKLQGGWITDGTEPPRDDNDVRVRRVPRPVPEGPREIDALLVPVEHWDSGVKSAVRSEFGGSVPIVQLLKINLGGDGNQFGLVEARQEGQEFSQHLPADPAVLVTNALEHDDDTRYAERGKYRREVHRLNDRNDLTTVGDTFDLAAVPELAAKGVTAEIVDRRDVERPYGDVTVFHVRIEREEADHVDLAFTETTPNWRSPDVYVDWVGNNDSEEPKDHRTYPVGTPTDQGENVRYPRSPSSDPEPHWIVGRVWNRGTVPAKNVALRYYLCDPPGSGDRDNFEHHRTETIDEVPADDYETVPARWAVDDATNSHSCLRIEIADWDVPEDPGDAVALATDDLWLSNNWAQQNVTEFVPVSGSPYEPIEFQYSLSNGGLEPERARLEPEGLPEGMKLTVKPGVRTVDPDEVAIFDCTLELDHEVVDAGCEGDRDFRLVAWRETPHTQERWGAVHYTVRPREKSHTLLKGNWQQDTVHLYGFVSPPAAGERVLLRLAFAHGDTRWHEAELTSGGTFDTRIEATERDRRSKYVEVFARYEGNEELAPSESDVLKLYQPVE